MTTFHLFSASSLPGALLFLLALAAIAGAVWLYRRAFAGPSRRAWRTPLVLRFLALAVFLLVLFRPVLSWETRERQDARVVVLIDTSKSMSVADASRGTRLDAARRILGVGQGGLHDTIADTFGVSLYRFDRDVQPLAPADVRDGRLAPDGEASDLKRAIEEAVRTEGDAPIAGVVLLTDGRENGKEPSLVAARSLGVPIFPVGLGSAEWDEGKIADLAVTRAAADPRVMVNDALAVKTSVSCAGLEGRTVAVELRHGKEVLDRKSVVLKTGANDVDLSWTPRAAGTVELAVSVEAQPEEKVRENNVRYLPVAVTGDKVQVLCYEGALRWEYKFVKQAFQRDPNLLVSCLVKTNEDKLYEQPAPGVKLGGAFPGTVDALARFDCVVLGDLTRADLPDAQAAAVKAYVSEKGGGVLFLPGRRALGADGIFAGPLAEVAPVTAGGGEEKRGDLAFEVTRSGAGHAALSGVGSLVGAASRLRLEDVYAVGGVKPGAETLATAGGGPLLVVQRYGQGHAGAYLTDSDWKWYMNAKGQGGEEAFTRLWGQLLRWLAQRDEPKGAGPVLRIVTDKDVYGADESIHATLEGPDPKDLLEKRATLAVEIADADGKKAEMPFEAAGDRVAGVFRPPRGGGWTISVRWIEGGQEKGAATRTVVVERPAKEMERLSRDMDLLRTLAAASGGRSFDESDATLLPDALRAGSRITVARVEKGVESSPFPFAVFAALLSAEWYLRKRRNVI